LSAGPHQLIRDGAVLVTKLDDVLEALGPLPQGAVEDRTLFAPQESEANSAPPPAAPQAAERDVVDLTDRQRKIVAQLDGQPVSADTIIERTGLSASEVFQELTLLTLKGVVSRVEGQTFMLRRRRDGGG